MKKFLGPVRIPIYTTKENLSRKFLFFVRVFDPIGKRLKTG